MPKTQDSSVFLQGVVVAEVTDLTVDKQSSAKRHAWDLTVPGNGNSGRSSMAKEQKWAQHGVLQDS